ncbi:hypothetical protein GGR57DRAFT_446300 [Xylariaceae sp. FL1272]|nr:hypothetical protein GGR57DRAFT_446300 [Xylariaceae sp. FL1272]
MLGYTRNLVLLTCLRHYTQASIRASIYRTHNFSFFSTVIYRVIQSVDRTQAFWDHSYHKTLHAFDCLSCLIDNNTVRHHQ